MQGIECGKSFCMVWYNYKVLRKDNDELKVMLEKLQVGQIKLRATQQGVVDHITLMFIHLVLLVDVHSSSTVLLLCDSSCVLFFK